MRLLRNLSKISKRATQRKFTHLFGAFAVTLLSGNTVHADDTEIFFANTTNSNVTPNVLFILDTSGSMGSYVFTQSPYDKTVTYTGSWNSGLIYVYKGSSYQGAIVESNVHCKKMIDTLADTGQFLSQKAASYSEKKWVDVLKNADYDGSIGWYDKYDIECKADKGVHGHNTTNTYTDFYARKGKNKPTQWTSNSNRKLDWSDFETYHYYSANYLNWRESNPPAYRTRIDIMKDVMNDLVDSTTGINIGLMRFNYSQGGRIITAMENIENNRSAFKTAVNGLAASGLTPLSESLYEAMLYYKGDKIYYGASSTSDAKDPSNVYRYKSPIYTECQPNNVVLLTDGYPYYDADTGTSDRTQIQGAIGTTCSGNCLDEVSKYMYDNDMSSALPDTQNITTYTIGFNIDNDLLLTAAEGQPQVPGQPKDVGGGGKYFTADDTSELSDAFKFILDSINATNTTFVTPGVAVNSFNRLNHRDELYFSVFKPESTPVWSGNLKRYRLNSDGVVKDVNDNDAVDPTTGYFKSTDKYGESGAAQSWWSKFVDGDTIALGGASENLPAKSTDRNAFTYIGGQKVDISTANKTTLTKDVMGIPGYTDAEHESLINWTRGVDVFDIDNDGDRDEIHKFLMDPLHSPPVVVIYGGDDDDPDTTIFYGDNQGYLHAVNGTEDTGGSYGKNGGEEIFAFMPKELLVNQVKLKEDSQATSHVYGMDGAIATWTYDANNNNQLTDSGDFVRIFSGMRRGGNSYYALDVTDRTNPQVMWQITGGTGDFTELGQTWSKPIKTKVKMGGNFIDVLIFAGGYDTNQDSVTTRSADSVGNAIYIVEAETGKLVWKATSSKFSDMLYSIPANIKAIDINSDGAADQMYVGDMGGQIWRFDIDNESKNSSLTVYGGVIAELADNTTSGNRRFYHAPDLSVLLDGGTRKLALAIGSGWQAHPLDTVVQDRFYMLKQDDVMEWPDANNDGVPDYTALSESDLYDATDNHLGHTSSENSVTQQTQAYSDFADAKGWYIKLERSGEKVLASSLTVDGELYFTTYEPSPNTTSCQVSAGTPRLFHVSLTNATPVKNYDGIGKDTELTRSDREVQLKTSSLPTSPQRLRIDGKDNLCIGTECESLEREEVMLKTYWVEEE